MKKLFYALLKKLFKGLINDLYDDMMERATVRAAKTKTEYDDRVVDMLSNEETKKVLLGFMD